MVISSSPNPNKSMAAESQSDSSESSFPILAIAIIGIIATSFVLLSYYLFVTKCCLNWQHFRIIAEISRSGSRRRRRGRSGGGEDLRGLDECAIQLIPNFRYQRGRVQRSFHECSVCLNEFREEERIRMLPNCFHLFHIDCIDTWLQTHRNCPICRSEITTSSPLLTNEIKERNLRQICSVEARRTEMTDHVSSMGDECVGVRGERGEFGAQPMRRSFSLDSSNDRLLCIAVQEILQKNRNLQALSNGEGSSNGGSGKVRRPFFSFSHSRSSKSAVLPIQN